MNKRNTITYGYLNAAKVPFHRSVQCDLNDDSEHFIEAEGKQYKARGYLVLIDLTRKKRE